MNSEARLDRGYGETASGKLSLREKWKEVTPPSIRLWLEPIAVLGLLVEAFVDEFATAFGNPAKMKGVKSEDADEKPDGNFNPVKR